MAVSVAAALAGEQDIVIGNVICDNILTLTLVFGLVGLNFFIQRLSIWTFIDCPFMVIATLMLFTLNKLSNNVSRTWGVMMLATAGLAFIFQTSYTIA